MPGLVTVVTPDVVGTRMAGPGIRAYHFAREISRKFETALVAGFEDHEPLDLKTIQVGAFGSAEARELLAASTIIIGQPHRETLRAARSGVPVIFDLFDPVVLELDQIRSGLRGHVHRFMESRRLLAAMRIGGRLITATKAQRDLYDDIAAGKGNPIEESRWITVPFGVPEEEPPDREKESPPVVSWNGGVWPWLDPLTAVSAIEEVNRRGTPARLSFMGTGRPNRDVTGALPVLESISKNDLVDWNPSWVPYLERAEVLSRASVSLMLHGDTTESRYSIRTRIFDAIWCGIPIVATRGGFAADLVEAENLGVVVPPGDAAAVADAIELILNNDVFRSRSVSALMRVRERFHWSEVCRPLLEAIDASSTGVMASDSNE